MSSAPIHVSDAEFQKTVLESKVPVIVDFWAPWCGPCKAVAPSLEKIAGEYADKLLVAKVNVDDNDRYSGQYGVQGIPTLLFINNGQVVAQQVGALPYAALKQRVDRFLSTVSQPVK